MTTKTKVKATLTYTTSNTHPYEPNTVSTFTDTDTDTDTDTYTFSSDWYETHEQMENFAGYDLLEVVKCGVDDSIVSSTIKFEYL